MVETSRRLRTYGLRTVYGLMLLYVTYLAWTSFRPRVTVAAGQRPPTAAASRRVQYVAARQATPAMAQLGNQLVGRIGTSQLIAVFLCVPLLVAGTLSAERKAATIDMLFITHLTDREIVVGKLASRLTIMAMLILAGLPILSLFTLFGGTDLVSILCIEINACVAMLFAGATAIYFSARSHTPYQALTRTYLVLLATLPLPFLSPFTSQALAPAMQMDDRSILTTCMASIAPCITAGLFLLFAVRELRTPMPPKAARRRFFTPSARRMKEKRPDVDDAPAVEGAPGEAAKRGMLAQLRSVWGPLRIKVVDEEPTIRKNLWIVPVVLTSLALNVSAIHSYESRPLAQVLLYLWPGIMVLVGVVATTNPLFTRRPGFFDLLLGTLLEPAEILQGAVMVSGPVLLRIFLVPYAFSAFWIYSDPRGIGMLLTISTLFSLAILGLGNLCSLADPSASQRIWPVVFFPPAVFLFPWFLPVELREAPAWLWLAAPPALLLVSHWWFHRSVSAASVGLLATAWYLTCVAALIGVASLAIGTFPQNAPLLYSPWLWMRESVETARLPDRLVQHSLGIYALALATTLLVGWRWTVQSMDQLVGRGRLPARNESGSRTAPAPALSTALAD